MDEATLQELRRIGASLDTPEERAKVERLNEYMSVAITAKLRERDEFLEAQCAAVPEEERELYEIRSWQMPWGEVRELARKDAPPTPPPTPPGWVDPSFRLL